MNAAKLIEQLTDSESDVAVCLTVVLRSSDDGLETLAQKNNSGEWGLCGGHQHKHETPKEAARRELEEESGIETDVTFLCDIKKHDRRQQPAKIYYCTVSRDTEAKAGSDAKKVKWLAVSDLHKLSADDQRFVKMAARKVRDPKKTIKEAIEEAGYTFPVHTLLSTITRAGQAGLLIIAPKLNRLAEDSLTRECASRGLACCVFHYGLTHVGESALKHAHHKKLLTPLIESLIRAADAAARWENEIQPRLAKGEIVICTPWIETDLSICDSRGLDPELSQAAFAWAPQPDLLIEDWNIGPVLESLDAYRRRN